MLAALIAMLTCSLALAERVVPVVGWTSNQNPCLDSSAGETPWKKNKFK